MPFVPVRSIQSCRLVYGRLGFTKREITTNRETVKCYSHSCREIVEMLQEQSVSDGFVVVYGLTMPAPGEANARERVRLRIIERLNDLGMTGRDFAKHFGHKDGWINAIRDGRNRLNLDDLDIAARVLKTTPGDLVRRGHEAWDLRPTEMRLMRAFRELPPTIQDYLVTLADYLVGVLPDEVVLLNEYRELTAKQQARIRHWTHVMLIAGEPDQGSEAPADLGGIDAPPREQGPRRKR